MKRTTLLITLLTIVFNCFAKDFKVEKAKYLITGPNTVSLIEDKNGTGIFDIPEKVSDKNGNSYEVTAIGTNAFKGNKRIKKIIIPSTVTEIGSKAFADCGIIPEFIISKGNSELTCNSDAFLNTVINSLEIDRDMNPSMQFIKVENRLSFGKDVKNISFESLNGCNNVKQIQIDGKVELPNILPVIMKKFGYKTDVEIKAYPFNTYQFIQKFQIAYENAIKQEQIENKLLELKAIDEKEGTLQSKINLIEFLLDNGKSSQTIDYYNKIIQDEKNLNNPEIFSLGVKVLNKNIPNSENSPSFEIYNELRNVAKEYNNTEQKKELAQLLKKFPKDLRTLRDNNLKFNPTSNSTCEVVGYIGNGGDLVIPETVISDEGIEYKVTSIGKRGLRDGTFTTITLPASVKEIGIEAFMNCNQVKKINIKGSDVEFGSLAFWGTPSLESIEYAGLKSLSRDPLKISDGASTEVRGKMLIEWAKNNTPERNYNWSLQNKYYEEISWTFPVMVMRLAAEKGYTDAMVEMCNYYFENDKRKNAVSDKEYLKWAKALQGKGNALGDYFMGVAYEYGIGLPINRRTASSYYYKAWNRGVDCERAYYRCL